jgi:hypothetical protein
LSDEIISKKGSLPVEVGRLFFYIRKIIKETEGSVLKKTTQDGGA